MSSIKSSYFKHLIDEGICKSSLQLKGSFEDALDVATFVPTFHAADESITLDLESRDSLIQGLSRDINLRTLVLMESIIEVNRNGSSKTLAWSFIKIYYASFYAAQIIMRLTGRWPVRIRSKNNFSDLISLYQGIEFKDFRDIYFCRFSDTDQIELEPIQDNGLKTHQKMWMTFALSLKDLINRLSLIAEGNSEVHDLIDQLESLLTDLGGDSSPFYLTNFRNELNYRMSYGLWYPHDKIKRDQFNILSGLMSFNLSPSNPPVYIPRNNNQPEKFLSITKFIINWALWMVSDSCSRFPKNTVFLPRSKLIKEHLIS